MKTFFAGLVAGLLLGAAIAWVMLRNDAHSREAEHALERSGAKPAANPLRLSAEKRAAAGITTAPATRTELVAEVKGYGRVLDPSPLVALLTEITSARAALAASEKELARLQKLHAQEGNASAHAVESAEAAVLRDRAQLIGTEGRLIAAWGPALARRTDLADLVSALAEQKSALVRIDLASGESPAEPPRSARVAPLIGRQTSQPVQLLGPAPAADALAQTPAYLALWTEHALPPGTALTASLATKAKTESAIVVPATAVVYHDGSAWVYALGKDDTFERRRIEILRSVKDGIAIASGIDDGMPVATAGAQQLLSAELQAGTTD